MFLDFGKNKKKGGLLVCTVLFVLDIKFNERIFKLHMFLCWLAFATNKILPMAGMVFVEVIPGRQLMLFGVHLKEPIICEIAVEEAFPS